MRYFSASAGSLKTYTVQPYRLALAQGGLYLVGWVPAYEAFRTFATERIERLSVTEETFKATRELPATLFASSLGVFSGAAEHVELEFTAGAAMFVRSRIWHDSQEITDLPGGGLRMTLLVCNDWALRNWLLGFGADVRVLAPTTLAASITTECQRVLDAYASPA
jgi:predicted DNA-binding transcriptional regulator YafY